MRAELPRNVSLCNCHCWGEAKGRRGTQGLEGGQVPGMESLHPQPAFSYPNIWFITKSIGADFLLFPESIHFLLISMAIPCSCHHCLPIGVPVSALAPLILSLLCLEPFQGSHLTQRKILSPYLPQPKRLLWSLPSVHSPSSLCFSHTQLLAVGSAWHYPTPGPLHLLFPPPGIPIFVLFLYLSKGLPDHPGWSRPPGSLYSWPCFISYILASKITLYISLIVCPTPTPG